MQPGHCVAIHKQRRVWRRTRGEPGLDGRKNCPWRKESQFGSRGGAERTTFMLGLGDADDDEDAASSDRNNNNNNNGRPLLLLLEACPVQVVVVQSRSLIEGGLGRQRQHAKMRLFKDKMLSETVSPRGFFLPTSCVSINVVCKGPQRLVCIINFQVYTFSATA